MADSFKRLREKTIDELIKLYDAKAKSTSVGLGFILDEIKRRENEEFNARLENFTKQMRNLTIAIFALTFLNVIILLYSLILY
jgi:hypothetical protein